MSKRKQKRRRTTTATPRSTAEAAPRRPIGSVAVVLAIALVTAVAYLPALEGGLIWDDDAHVTKPELRSLDGLRRIWFDLGATQQYYPLLHSLFWVEHKLWGDAPLGYHLANLLLHITAASLVYFILRRLEIPGAALAAAIFAVHPVHVESVAWITEQKNTLSAAFYLSAMLVYLQFDKRQRCGRSPDRATDECGVGRPTHNWEFDEQRETRLYWLAFGLFVLGLLSKTVTATLPAALLVVFWWRRGSLSWRRDALPLVPWFALGAAAGLLTAWVELKLIGAEGADYQLSLVQRGLLAGRVIWFYLAKLVWPAELIFIYPRWDVSAGVWWQWLFPLATLALFALLWAVRRRWRGPLAAGCLFVGTLFPVLGFLNVYPFVYSYVADHFQYLASLAVITLTAAGISLAVARLPHRTRWAGYMAASILVATLAVLTSRQCRMYSDSATLYATTIKRNPTCWMAHLSLGTELARAGRTHDAMDHYRQALRIKPDYADAHGSLGILLVDTGQAQVGFEHLEHSVRLAPDSYEAQYRLGLMLLDTGNAQDAAEHFAAAARLFPDSSRIHNNWGVALFTAGRWKEAAAAFRIAIELEPGFAEAHDNLRKALAADGQSPEAHDRPDP